jgi:hypothetical protein
MQFLPENNVYVYFRYDEKDTVMVIINNSNQTQSLKLERFTEILPTKKGMDIISGNLFDPAAKSWNVEGKSSLVIEF